MGWREVVVGYISNTWHRRPCPTMMTIPCATVSMSNNDGDCSACIMSYENRCPPRSWTSDAAFAVAADDLAPPVTSLCFACGESVGQSSWPPLDANSPLRTRRCVSPFRVWELSRRPSCRDKCRPLVQAQPSILPTSIYDSVRTSWRKRGSGL